MEGGQREVKQNLVKFNNFVREKQGKVEGGLERARMEVVLQVMYLSLANPTLGNSSPVSRSRSVYALFVANQPILSSPLDIDIDEDVSPSPPPPTPTCRVSHFRVLFFSLRSEKETVSLPLFLMFQHHPLFLLLLLYTVEPHPLFLMLLQPHPLFLMLQ